MEESYYHQIADAEMARLLQYAETLEENSDIEAELDSGVLNNHAAKQAPVRDQ